MNLPLPPREVYQKLLANWNQADADVNGLDEAKRAVAGPR